MSAKFPRGGANPFSAIRLYHTIRESHKIATAEKVKSHDGDILSYVTFEYIGPVTGHNFVKLTPGMTTSSSNDLLTHLSPWRVPTTLPWSLGHTPHRGQY